MKFVRKTDIIIIIAVAVIAAGLAIWAVLGNERAEKGSYAEIYYRSGLAERIDLASETEKTFSIKELPEVVFQIYSDGSIAFISSDCPDKVCINTGKISRSGQFAACLPNEIYVKIVSDNDTSDPDIIIG